MNADEVTSRSFTLVNENGEMKACLFHEDGTTFLNIYGPSDRSALSISVDASGHPLINVFRADGTLAFGAGITQELGCGASFHKKDGSAGFKITETKDGYTVQFADGTRVEKAG